MPHKCVRCGNIYEDAQLNGCSCGSQLFFFVKTLEEAHSISHVKIKKPKKRKKSKKFLQSSKFNGMVETIHEKRSGIYEINLEALLKSKPIIVHEKDEKKFTIDLKSIFKSV